MFDARKLLEAFAGASQQMNAAPPSQQPQQSEGGFGGILDQLRNAAGQQGQGGQPGAGGLMDVLGQVLGQATQGVREGAGRINDATGIGTNANDALRQATGGRGAEDLLGTVKDLMQNNKAGTGAVLGGLAAILLGTQAGRGMLGAAAKLGGAALIGGLAYKALQNYQAGRPLITGPDPVTAAPPGSGFEPDAVSQDTAITYLRAMIAAASADGTIDRDEAQRISGAFQQAGMGEEASRFLQQEYANPASPDELAAAATSPEVAVQIYTAARITVDPRQENNRMFLDALAERLGMDRDLTAHIDAQALYQG